MPWAIHQFWCQSGCWSGSGRLWWGNVEIGGEEEKKTVKKQSNVKFAFRLWEIKEITL
jgi:hypothetical protein